MAMQWPDVSGEVHLQRDRSAGGPARHGASGRGERTLRLTESLAAGTPDRYSDVDLVVLVEPGHLGCLWDARVALTTVETPVGLDLDHHRPLCKWP